jgi:dipeptidyl aminopeptidase/acylaminoacyl peptidase
LFYRDRFQSLEDLSQPVVKLAGLRIDPTLNIKSNLIYRNRVVVVDASTGEEMEVAGLPENPRIANMKFSPDNTKMAFTNTTENGVELWLLEVSKAEARRVAPAVVNAVLDNPYQWFGDSRSLMVRVVSKDRLLLNDNSGLLPDGPVISESEGKKSKLRTYQDLLKNSADEYDFETLVTSDLVIYDLYGNGKLFLKEALFQEESISPDGKYVMVTTIEKPYSYSVPYGRFPKKTVVYDLSGEQLVSFDRDKRKFIEWRSDKPSAIFFVSEYDAEDSLYKDLLYLWEAPFDSSPTKISASMGDFRGIMWGDDNSAIFRERGENEREYKKSIEKFVLFSPSDTTVSPIVISERDRDDKYCNKGIPVRRKNERGFEVLMIRNHKLYMSGDGYSDSGKHPFVDIVDLRNLTKERIYQSSPDDGRVEEIKSLDNIDKGLMIVTLESLKEYPDYYLRRIDKRRNNLKKITDFGNPIEGVSQFRKQLLRYRREDGVRLSAILYLPENYSRDNGDTLPLLIWAYPREFKDTSLAEQSQLNALEYTYPTSTSFIYWVAKGYAVLQDASFPILGSEENEPNDTFVEQLVMNAEAAIDAVDSVACIDKQKVAVGGHSYGAFMTANLLSHSDLFACGVARSGAYNRTLTPFGFQNEKRTYWNANDVYYNLSPFMHAHKVKTPMLLVHGEQDNNSGTYTMQTIRYFQALKGLGADVRMVILPKESHSYRARENILHLLWEQERFFERYLRD